MIVAFDLATTTGVACGRPCDVPVAWSFRLTGSHDKRFGEMLRTVNRIFREREPTNIVIEAPFVGRHPAVARLLYGLRGVVLGVAHLHGVDVQERMVSDIRKYFLGHAGGRRKDAKARVMERCREIGWTVRNDDEADALALWSMRAAEIDPDHGRRTLFPGSLT